MLLDSPWASLLNSRPWFLFVLLLDRFCLLKDAQPHTSEVSTVLCAWHYFEGMILPVFSIWNCNRLCVTMCEISCALVHDVPRYRVHHGSSQNFGTTKIIPWFNGLLSYIIIVYFPTVRPTHRSETLFLGRASRWQAGHLWLHIFEGCRGKMTHWTQLPALPAPSSSDPISTTGPVFSGMVCWARVTHRAAAKVRQHFIWEWVMGDGSPLEI